MKISGRNIKRRLGGLGVARIRDRVTRARHFRGHGVHSPFVYAIVRQVFMRSRPLSDDSRLREELLALGVPAKRALQLQNLCTHCGYGRFAVDVADADADMVVLTAGFPTDGIADVCRAAEDRGTTLAVMAPHADRHREQACREIVERHACTTVDNRGYLLIFNNHLPKQHFRL